MKLGLIIVTALSLVVSTLIPEDLAYAMTPPPYDIKGSKCDIFGLNCKPVYWEITVMTINTELVDSGGKLIWNYTPGLAAEYVANTIVYPEYNLNGSNVHYFLQISSADDGVVHQIISSKIDMGGDRDKYIRIPLQINQTGTYDLRLFFWGNDTGMPTPLSHPETKTIPVNGCMCNFGGAYQDDYLAAYPLQTIKNFTVRLYDAELVGTQHGYVGIPLVLKTWLNSNSNNTLDYLYIVEFIDEETGKIEESLTFEGTMDSRGGFEVNATITFENEGRYMMRAQVFNASSEDSPMQPISERFVEYIEIYPESEREFN